VQPVADVALKAALKIPAKPKGTYPEMYKMQEGLI
jgi:hypothetical protein